MASKRKSTTPCMIPLKTLALESGTELTDEYKDKSSKDEPQQILPDLMDSTEMLSNGHQNLDGMRFFCKYCNFGSHETSPFVEHMNSKHNDFREDPSYVCIACSFLVKDSKELEAHNADCHPGDSDLSWTVAKHESYTVVEQSVGGQNTDQDVTVHCTEERLDDYSEIAITKTPIMKIMKNKLETKKIITIKDNANHVSEELERKSRSMPKNGSISASKVTSNILNSQIVNGSIIGTVPVLQTGVTQLVSLNPPQTIIQPKLPAPIVASLMPKQSVVQKHQQLPTAKSLPKVMIPLSSIPTYNSSMDSNCFLKNNFNKFPYPTKAELCYLTVVTKYPEEQIKIWFTAQRLKQGISWSPEEIEDSRKKMFNTVIQSIPQPVPQPTITVLNAPLVANASNVQHLIQAALPGQIVSQPQGAGGLFVTQPIITNGIQGTATSVSLTVTPFHTSQTTTAARTASLSGKLIDSSKPVTATSPSMPSPNAYDPINSRCKKSRQQLSALKNSFCKSQFPSHGEVARLTRITGLSTRDVRKWFSDKRYHFRNKPASYLADSGELLSDPQSDAMFTMVKEPDDFALPTSGHTPLHSPRRPSWNQAPDFTLTRYKERAPEQLRALENSFAEDTFPSVEEVNRLRSETKMTRREIDSWFSEKRKRVAEDLKKDHSKYLDDGENSADEMEISEVKVSDDLESHVENSSPVSERKVNPIKINLKALRVTESGDNTESSKDNSMASDGGSRPSTPQKNRQSCKKTAQQRDCLKQMFVKTRWPSVEEYDSLVEQTGLPRTDIVRWFGDCRYSYKNGNLKWYDSYKKVFNDLKPQYHQPLLDYYSRQQTVYEDDIDDLCEKTRMSAADIRAWFAERLEEDKQGASDEGSDDLQLDCAERQTEATHDGISEVAHNSEGWELNAQETTADSRSSQQSIAQLAD